MAKKLNETEEELSSQLMQRTIAQIEQLWAECSPKFFDAMDDSERKRILVKFGVTLDTKEAAAVVDTEISFMDNTKEGGMRVRKVFRKNITEELDPAQGELPGMNRNGEAAEAEAAEEQPKKRSRKKKSENPFPE